MAVDLLNSNKKISEGKQMHIFAELGLHILFWLLYFFFPYLQHGSQEGFNFNWNLSVVSVISLILSIYLVQLLLYYKTPKKWLIAIAILVVIGIIGIACLYQQSFCECPIRMCLLHKLTKFTLIQGLFIGLFFFKKNAQTQRALQYSENKRIEAELEGLKSQLNPHFLFNTLHMLYADALNSDSVLADKILKLSDGLHYMLHEGNNSLVPVEKEIQFITNYIELQKARLGNKVEVQFRVDENNHRKLIPTLLLLTFVENAFKYTSMMPGNYLPINIDIQTQNSEFVMLVKNYFVPEKLIKRSVLLKKSGIGIDITKKRLSLIFNENYQLNISNENDLFIVYLKLPLQ